MDVASILPVGGGGRQVKDSRLLQGLPHNIPVESDPGQTGVSVAGSSRGPVTTYVCFYCHPDNWVVHGTLMPGCPDR